jgi:hypothetical protein
MTTYPGEDQFLSFLVIDHQQISSEMKFPESLPIPNEIVISGFRRERFFFK